MHRRIRGIVGDTEKIDQELKGINFELTLEQSQKLVNLICRYKRWPVYKVIYSNRCTKRVFATCDSSKKEIVIHNMPETVQLLLHEITHIKEDGHTEKFQKLELKLIKLYKNKFMDKILKVK